MCKYSEYVSQNGISAEQLTKIQNVIDRLMKLVVSFKLCFESVNVNGGKIGVGGSEFWERDIVDKRADYDRLIRIFSAYITHKPVVHVCRECFFISLNHKQSLFGISNMERGSSAVECRTRNQVSPVRIPICYSFADCAFSFSTLTP